MDGVDLGSLAFRLARTHWGGWLLRWGFLHARFMIPMERMRETAALVAFVHPRPAYPVHILLVPKKAYRSLADLPPDDTAFLQDLITTVQDLVGTLGLQGVGYRLVVNGGGYQEVPVLHFHLISAAESVLASPQKDE